MRELTHDELAAVVGGFGLQGPPPGPPTSEEEPIVVRGVRRRDDGMTHGLFLQLQEFEQEAQSREVLCNMTAEHQRYLQAESDEREIVPYANTEAGGVVGGALLGAIRVVGWPLSTGFGINSAIGARYQREANAVARYRHQNGCPALPS